MKERVALQFPLGGLVRSTAYQSQPPFTTPDCLNVRPRDVFQRRYRGGSRAGSSKAFTEQLGDGSSRAINLLGSVRPIEVAKSGVFDENFRATSSTTLAGQTGYTAPGSVSGWAGWDDDDIRISPRTAFQNINTTAAWIPQTPITAPTVDVDGHVVHTVLPDLDSTEVYEFRMLCRRQNPRPGDLRPAWMGEYHIFALLDDTTPDIDADGIKASLKCGTVARVGATLPDGNGMPDSTKFELQLQRVVGGTVTSATNSPLTITISPFQASVTLHVRIAPGSAGSHDVTVFVNNDDATANSLTINVATAVGHRWGLGLTAYRRTYWSTLYYYESDPLIDRLTVLYAVAGDGGEGTRFRRLVAGADGTAYVENSAGEMRAITSTISLKSDRLLQGVERGGRFFIADYGDVTKGTAGTATGTSFDDASIADWRTVCDTGYVITFTSGTNTVAGRYTIAAVAENTLTLGSDPTSGGNGSSMIWRLERAPKVLNPDAATLARWDATDGSIPLGCPVIGLYNDHIYLAGAETDPQLWYRSRQGDPYDWLTGGDLDDVGRPIASTNSDAGVIADAITGFSPTVYNYAVFFAENSVWVLQGNPGGAGRILNLSRAVGAIAVGAWCHGPRGEVYFLSRDGLYVLPAGSESLPEPLSRDKIPEELIQLNTDNTRVLMQFSILDRGVYIWLTPEAEDAVVRHWFFDMESGTFWPDRYPADLQPMSVHSHNLVGAEDRIVLLGGRDGYIRRFDDEAPADDGTEFDAYVVYGPIMLATDMDTEGLVTELIGQPALSSEDVAWEVYVGDSGEHVWQRYVDGEAFATGTWASGVNTVERPRGRGVAMLLKVTRAADAQRWAMERVTLVRKVAGRLRLA